MFIFYSDLRPSKPAACQQISLITNYTFRNKRLLTGKIMQNSPNEFLTPRHIDVTSKSPTHARIVLEPLERGFGHTLGNALRRILLSSIFWFTFRFVYRKLMKLVSDLDMY